MARTTDSRSALSIGMDWGTRVTTIGLEFALPAVVGLGLDRWLATTPWLTVVGALLGIGVGMMHVLRLAQTLAVPTGRPADKVSPSEGPRNPDRPG